MVKGNVLELPDSLRAALEIEPGAQGRVVDRIGSMLLVACGSDDPRAMPTHGHLVLCAELGCFSPADLLSLLHAAGKSGLLLFRHGDHRKSIYLNRGEVIFAGSNQEADRLGTVLLRQGVLTQPQLDQANARFDSTQRFGKILVELGLIAPRELWNAVKLQVEEIVRSVFAYAGGWIQFWEGEVEPDNVVRLSLPTRRLIAEGLERREALLRKVAWLEDGRTRLRRGAAEPRDLTGVDRRVVECLDHPISFTALCERTGLDAQNAARTIEWLELSKHVVAERVEPAPPRPTGPSLEEQRLAAVCEAYAKLIAELAAPLVAIDGAAALRERLAPILEDAAARHPALLGGLVLGSCGEIDPSELTRRTLAIQGDRERTLGAGLEELVVYLEFELKNHPQIDDATPFLEAVLPLRATVEG